MANEFRIQFPSGNTLYGVARNASGQVWYQTGGVFEDYGTSGRTANDYAITMTDKLGGFYVGDFPTDISAGDYIRQIRIQLGSSPADTDTELGSNDIAWTGVAEEEEAVAEVGADDICKYALAKIGGASGDKWIDSIYDGTHTAALCLLLYPLVRNEVLHRWPYNETKKFADLGAALAGDSLPADADWDYVFNLPGDCVAVINQVHEDSHKTVYEHDVKCGKLFTNELTNTDEDSAYIEYVFKQKDASKYSPMLIEAIATKLGAELAPTIADTKEADRLLGIYEKLVTPMAQARNQDDLYSDDEGDFSWFTARTS